MAQSKVQTQFDKFVHLRRKYKFEARPEVRLDYQAKLVGLQLYSDLELEFNKDLTEDERLMLKSMGKINIGRPNDRESI